jgi:hypothetical protein
MLIMNVSDNSDDLLLPCMSSLSWRILVCWQLPLFSKTIF